MRAVGTLELYFIPSVAAQPPDSISPMHMQGRSISHEADTMMYGVDRAPLSINRFQRLDRRLLTPHCISPLL